MCMTLCISIILGISKVPGLSLWLGGMAWGYESYHVAEPSPTIETVLAWWCRRNFGVRTAQKYFSVQGWMSGVHYTCCLSWTTQDQRPAKIWIPLIKHANRRLPMKTAPLSHFGIIQKTIEVATFCTIPPQSLWSLLDIYGHYMDIRYTVIWTLYLYGYIYIIWIYGD